HRSERALYDCVPREHRGDVQGHPAAGGLGLNAMRSTEWRGGKPGVVPDLDPDFAPAALFHRAFDAAVASSGGAAVGIALEHADGSVYRWTTGALPAEHPDARHNFLNLERQVKFLL